MINWVDVNGRNKMRKGVDVSIHFVNKRTRMTFRFPMGVVAAKFGHANKLLVGADDKQTRLYFRPSEEGFTLSHPTESGKYVVNMSVEKLEKVVDKPSDLIGDYVLTKDAEADAWYIKIGACSVGGAR